MERHVLLVALGPVQDFIASARRCRDLWFGSWVLSDLARAAAAEIVDAIGGEEAVKALIFPAAPDRRSLDPGSVISVANKLVVRVPGDAKCVLDVANRGREGMRARLRELRGAAFGRIGDGDEDRRHHFREETAILQVDELFEYTWVAVPEAEGDGGYASAREEAERLLGARKNLRAWAQPKWASGGVPKSSLDGVRESVLHEDLYPQPVVGAPSPRMPSAEERRRWYGVHAAERLCGVGLFKRWGVQLDADGRPRTDRFFSTAHVAALPLLAGLGGDLERVPGLLDAWEKLRLAAGPAVEQTGGQLGHARGAIGNTDGSLLFAERLAESLDELGHPRRSDVTGKALEALRIFLGRARRGEPVPYYAILVADGDRMGEVIDNQRSPAAHRALSAALDTFARDARASSRAMRGVSSTPAEMTCSPFSRFIERSSVRATSRRPSPSGSPPGRRMRARARPCRQGSASCTFLDPMGAALDVARKAERVAKGHLDKDGNIEKNALAIALDKRVRRTTVVCGHWAALVPRLLALAELHDADAIPDKAGHELAELARLTDGAAKEELAGLSAIQRSEALRILGRKRAKRGKEKIVEETLDWLRAHADADPVALGGELAIARLIADAKAQARPASEEAV